MAPSPSVSILVVDDEPRNLLALEAALASVDCDLITALSGQSALKCLLSQDFAAIVLDMHMSGMDAFETASLIRARQKSRLTPIIFLTADDLPEARVQDGYRLGAVDYMRKPFDPNILRSKVSFFVELTRQSVALAQRTAELTSVTSDLVQREQQVVALNVQLEERVIERTAALEAAVKELEAEVAERQRAEATLSASEERSRLALQGAAMGIWDIDLATGAALLSDVARRITGMSSAAPRTFESFLTIVHPDDRESVRVRISNAVATDSEIDGQFAVIWADRSVHWVDSRGQLVKDAGGRPVRITGTVRDITDWKVAEQALRRSESRLQGMVQSAMDAIVSVDDEQRIVLFNTAAERMFGYSADQALDQPLKMLLPERHRASSNRPLEGFAEPGLTSGAMGNQRSLLARRADGTEFPIDATSSQVMLESGPLFTVILRDITDRLEAERQRDGLARSEKMRALGQMATGIAHDLNQSLMLIAGYSELARQALIENPPNLIDLEDLLLTSTQAALDGGEAVKRLLLFTRAAPDQDVDHVDLSTLIREAAQLTAPRWRDAAQAEGRPISLHVEAQGNPTIKGSASQLRELLTNVIFNAVDALPTGGTIRLRVLGENGLAIIEVVDSGIGMTPEIQARVFEPFFTTKGEAGTGLGLAMVFRIVDQHGGHIEVRSTPGEGTMFRITLPLTNAHVAGHSPAAPPPQLEARRCLRILAVDDEPMMTRAVARMLKPSGHIVSVAGSGEEALELLSQQTFDVVVSDMGMGAGMNGWELADAVRQRWPGVRFLLATGWGAAIDPTEAHLKGVDAVLAKPYHPADLVRAVDRTQAAA